MGWFVNLMEGSKSDKYERIQQEIDMLESKLFYLENANGIYQRGTDGEIQDIQREIDKLLLELRCMEAGL